MVQQKGIQLVSMRTRVHSLALLSGLRIRNCCEQWCRLQVQLGPRAAMAVTGSCSSDSTPSLGTSICHKCSPTKQNKQQKKPHTCKKEKIFECLRTGGIKKLKNYFFKLTDETTRKTRGLKRNKLFIVLSFEETWQL